jgi:hypothetical protein
MLPLAASHFSAGGRKQNLFKAGYLTAIAVSTVGWVIGLSWLTMSAAHWLFF